jgi:hypothetical protein
MQVLHGRKDVARSSSLVSSFAGCRRGGHGVGALEEVAPPSVNGWYPFAGGFAQGINPGGDFIAVALGEGGGSGGASGLCVIGLSLDCDLLRLLVS